MNDKKKPVNSIVPLYANLGEQLELLPDDQQRYAALMAIYNYGIYEEEPAELPPMVKMIFLGVKPNIDAYYKRANGGKKGGRPKKTEADQNGEDITTGKNNPMVKPKVYTDIDKDIDKDIDVDVDTDTDISLSFSNTPADSFPDATAPGTAAAYRFSLGDCFRCRDNNGINMTDSEVKAFYDLQTGRGWKIKGQPIKELANAMQGYKTHVLDKPGGSDQLKDYDAELLEILTNEKRMHNKAADAYGMYQGFKKLLSAEKAKRLYEKAAWDFIKKDSEDLIEFFGWYEDSGEDTKYRLEPDRPTFKQERNEALKDDKSAELMYEYVMQFLARRAVRELVSKLQYEEKDDNTIFFELEEQFRKYFTTDEFRNLDLVYEINKALNSKQRTKKEEQ